MTHPCVFRREGILFRLPGTEDLDTAQRLRNEDSTWIHLSDPRPVGPADQQAWLQSIGWKTGRMYLVAYDKENPFIGLVRMDELDSQNRSLRIGLDVLPELRRQGNGTCIYKAIMDYAFSHLNIHRLWLCVLKTNRIAMRLYRKLGFKAEGCYRKAIFRHGQYQDYVIMSILEEEYRRGQAGK